MQTVKIYKRTTTLARIMNTLTEDQKTMIRDYWAIIREVDAALEEMNRSKPGYDGDGSDWEQEDRLNKATADYERRNRRALKRERELRKKLANCEQEYANYINSINLELNNRTYEEDLYALINYGGETM